MQFQSQAIKQTRSNARLAHPKVTIYSERLLPNQSTIDSANSCYQRAKRTIKARNRQVSVGEPADCQDFTKVHSEAIATRFVHA
jgi:hypothetical protein